MATISEDYVSFETAKLLKEKGFDSPCMGRYSVRSKEFHLDCTKMCNNGGLFEYAAPTQAMAMKWLREVHDCPIEILWNWDADSQCSNWYFVHHMELKPRPRIQYYDTYEEAAEAAIKYCLENLI